MKNLVEVEDVVLVVNVKRDLHHLLALVDPLVESDEQVIRQVGNLGVEAPVSSLPRRPAIVFCAIKIR